MKIALVHDFLTQWGGGENVLKALSEIWPTAPIYVLAKDQAIIDEFLPGRTIRPSYLQQFPGMPKAFKYYLPLMPRAIESFDLAGYDVVLSDASAFAKGAITKPPTKHICYLHTPTRYLTSDAASYLATAPIPFPLVGKPIVRALLHRLKNWDLRASRRPDYLIANSHYIAERTKQYYQRTPDQVLFPPVETERFYLAKTIGDYWLTLGRNEPYKRIDLAILAANKLGLKLKVVGGGTKLATLKQLAGPTIEFVGRVSDEELADLYARAIGLIFPPEEDAGIVPLEAMASGRPVIAFGKGGALESVVAGKTGEFFARQTVESITQVLRTFRPEDYDPKIIRHHAEQFDTKVFQKAMQAIVAKVLNDTLS
ncbi:glycosyltransferase [Candidatus Berkelbacteria bacterium]|nr:glycosyltransferase [Candidatus Berkelbacteria bacterium]